MNEAKATRVTKVAILGGGSMGIAIARGLIAAGFSEQLVITTRTSASAEKLATELNSESTKLEFLNLEANPAANALAASAADLVVLAVKPAGILATCAEIKAELRPGAVVISVAAGIPLATLAEALQAAVTVVRAMPNTPARIGKALTGLAFLPEISDDAKVLASAVFNTLGKVAVVTDEQINALSAISGSGPAYFYAFVEAFEQAALSLGFDSETAALLVRETFLGSALLLAESADSPTALREQVTSPKGTTFEALSVINEAQLATVLSEAVAAAVARAEAIARGE